MHLWFLLALLIVMVMPDVLEYIMNRECCILQESVCVSGHLFLAYLYTVMCCLYSVEKGSLTGVCMVVFSERGNWKEPWNGQADRLWSELAQDCDARTDCQHPERGGVCRKNVQQVRRNGNKYIKQMGKKDEKTPKENQLSICCLWDGTTPPVLAISVKIDIYKTCVMIQEFLARFLWHHQV